jgi:hypothetical protein
MEIGPIVCRLLVLLLLPFPPLSALGQLHGDPHPGPVHLTMDEKVKQADFVFIGKAIRLYFVDDDYNEIHVSNDQRGFVRTAMDVRVTKVLRAQASKLPQFVSIDIASGRSLIESQRQEYLGRELIYFTKAQTIDQVNQSKPVVRHYRPTIRALKGPIANPLPLEFLDEVMAGLQSNSTVETDARKSGTRGSP